MKSIRFFAALGIVCLPIVAYAAAPGSIEVTCDVDRTMFRSAASGQTQVTFRIWSAESGGTECDNRTVAMNDLVVFKAKTDRYDAATVRKFAQIRAVLGSDDTPIQLCSGPESWLDVTVGLQTLTCDFSSVPPGPRRRLQSVPFANQGGGGGAVPAGAIILWDGGACPAGFSLVTTYDNKFLVASGTAGTTGGSNTHTHDPGSYSAQNHTHSVPYSGWTFSGSNTDMSQLAMGKSAEAYARPVQDNVTGPANPGGITGTSAAADSRPEFKTITLCRKD